MKLYTKLSVSVSLAIAFILALSPNTANASSNDSSLVESGCANIAVLMFRGANSISASSGASSDLGKISVDAGVNDSYLRESSGRFMYIDKDGNDLYETSGWEGPTISRLLGQTLPILKEKGVSVDLVGVGAAEGYGPNDSTIIEPYPLGLGFQYKLIMWSKTQSSAAKVLKYMNSYNKTCPNTKFYLIGHSMGAMVVHHLWEIAPQKIAGAYLIGDPLQLSYGAKSGTTSTGSNGNGMFTQGWLYLPLGDPRLTARVNKFYIGYDSTERRMMCHDNDTLCQWEKGDSFLQIMKNTEHINYFNSDNKDLPADPHEILEEGSAVAANIEELAQRNRSAAREAAIPLNFTIRSTIPMVGSGAVISVEPNQSIDGRRLEYVVSEQPNMQGIITRSNNSVLIFSAGSRAASTRLLLTVLENGVPIYVNKFDWTVYGPEYLKEEEPVVPPLG